MPVLRPLHLALVTLATLTGCGRSAQPQTPDLVVYGRIWTGDSARPWAAAVAVAGDTIQAVGDSASIAALAGPGTRVLANGSAMVTPGLMDGHLHFTDGGFQLASVDLRPANSPDEFISRLKAYALERQPGEWILGGNWDHERWPDAPLPRREWIDSVTRDNPVFVYRLDGHMGLANSAALRAAGVDRRTRDIQGGVIVRDRRTGEPTGVLKDMAMAPVERAIPVPTDAQRDAALRRAMAHAASRGVTAFAHVSVVPADLGTYLRAKAAGALTARATLYFPLETWHAVADTVARLGRGDDWVRIGGVKGYVDGSLGSTTALFYTPYADDPTTAGVLVTPEDSLRAWIGASDSAGLQVAVHAIGERANGLVLDIYDSVARAHGPRDRRFRIEHAQHLRRQDIERIARLGVVASMQPYHVIDDGRWAQKRIGPERIKTTYAFRSLLDRKAHLAFGSDWTVAPLDPILGIYAAVTRRTLDGKHPDGWVPEEKISVEEALRAYTAGDAYGAFAERTRGRLAPGYKADLVLLDQDLTRIAPEAIERVAVRATVVGGRVVFEAK
ncbi:MAG TPA: amidohydrolase [Gemmatimonadales bacterium]|nr:amidohydrolase [Gemmatimonadales bacterium]